MRVMGSKRHEFQGHMDSSQRLDSLYSQSYQEEDAWKHSLYIQPEVWGKGGNILLSEFQIAGSSGTEGGITIFG